MRGVRAVGVLGVVAGAALYAVVPATAAGAATSTPAPATSAPSTASASAPAAVSTGSPLRQASWVVWLDLEARRLAVEQDVELINPGATDFAGEGTVPGLGADRHPVLRLPIAPGGTNLQYVGQFEGCCAVVDGGSLVLTQPAKPGTSQGTVRYEVPLTPQLDLTVLLPTDNLVVLVPPALHLDAPQLSASGTSSDRGVTYRAYRASTLVPGTTVTLRLAPASGRPSVTSGWWATGITGAVLVLGGALVLLRRRARRTGRKPVAGPSGRAPGSGPMPSRRGDDTEQLVEEIALLDLAFERGAINDEATYRRVRAAVLDRLTANAGDAEPVATESGRR